GPLAVADSGAGGSMVDRHLHARALRAMGEGWRRRAGSRGRGALGRQMADECSGWAQADRRPHPAHRRRRAYVPADRRARANTGMQGMHNAMWKLALYLKGKAGQQLLQTYEDERRPVARWVADQSYHN